jgi:hypothetical protein
MSKILKALANLTRASYLDGAPTEDQRCNWRQLAADALGERDRLAARVAELEAATVKRCETCKVEINFDARWCPPCYGKHLDDLAGDLES